MKKTLNITCLCSAVHVRLSGEAAAQFHCHCDDCQATSGGAYVAVAVYPADAVSHTKGELVAWTLSRCPESDAQFAGLMF